MRTPVTLSSLLLFVVAIGVAPSAAQPIQVVRGTYGENCGAAKGNITELLARECDGKIHCVVDLRALDDPDSSCVKKADAVWLCGKDDSLQHGSEMIPGMDPKSAVLSCWGYFRGPPPEPSRSSFEDTFQRPDSKYLGNNWSEYTVRNGRVGRILDSPWSISGGTLRYENSGVGIYLEDFVETQATFPSDNIRVEFELRGQAATSKGYVGPTVFWSGKGALRSTAQNVTSGPRTIGVAAWYGWETQGTRGVAVIVDGTANIYPDALFAGLNQDGFARHVLTIKNGILTYEAPGFGRVSYPIPAEALRERRHFSFGARLYDPGVRQVIEIRNLKITSLDPQP